MKQSRRLRLTARELEESGAGKPHAGICEGRVEKSAFLPSCKKMFVIEWIIEILFFTFFAWVGHWVVKMRTFGKVKL